MSKKFTATAAAVTATLALLAGPVMADDDAVETEVSETEVENVMAAAAHARNAARELEKDNKDGEEESEDEESEDEDSDGDELTSAEEALTAALERLSQEGVGGNGVAAEILTALLAGESPAGIGAEHGAMMAEDAKTRRDERAAAREEAGHGKPEHAGQGGAGRGNRP